MIGIVVLAWIICGIISVPVAGCKFGMVWPPVVHLLGGPILLTAILITKGI